MALAKLYTVEPIYRGLSAIVVAGGPSLCLKDIRTIAMARMQAGDRLRVLAVNDAIYPAWFADWLHACDGAWWHHHIQSVHRFPGIKTTMAEDVPEPWVTGYLRNTGDLGFDPDPSCCRTGGNGVYQAVHMLIHAGVKKIILVGVDMRPGPHGEKHWFGDHPLHFNGTAYVDYENQMIKRFLSIEPALTEHGVSVLNATLGSALKIFPFCDLEKELRLSI